MKKYVYFEIHQGIEIISLADLDISQRNQELNYLDDRSSTWTDISSGTQKGRWRGGMSNREQVFSEAYSTTGEGRASVTMGNTFVDGEWQRTWVISSATTSLGPSGHRSNWDLRANPR